MKIEYTKAAILIKFPNRDDKELIIFKDLTVRCKDVTVEEIELGYELFKLLNQHENRI